PAAPGVGQRHHVVDVDLAASALAAAEVDGAAGVRIVQRPGQHPALSLVELLVGQVPDQDLVACVLAVAVEVGPPVTELVALVAGDRLHRGQLVERGDLPTEQGDGYDRSDAEREQLGANRRQRLHRSPRSSRTCRRHSRNEPEAAIAETQKPTPASTSVVPVVGAIQEASARNQPTAPRTIMVLNSGLIAPAPHAVPWRRPESPRRRAGSAPAPRGSAGRTGRCTRGRARSGTWPSP